MGARASVSGDESRRDRLAVGSPAPVREPRQRDVIRGRIRLEPHQPVPPHRIPASPSVPRRETGVVLEIGHVTRRAVVAHDVVVVGNATEPVAGAPAPAPIDAEVEDAAAGVVGIEPRPPRPATRPVTVVAQIARVLDLVVNVVGGVAGAEGIGVSGVNQHSPSDALHGHERIADDATVAGDTFVVVAHPFVAHLFRLQIVRTEVPGQFAERVAGGDGDHVALAHRSLHHQVHVRTLRRHRVGAPPLEEATAPAVWVQKPHEALGVDLVDQQVGVVRGPRPDLHGLARLVDRVIPAVGPHFDTQPARPRRRGRPCEQAHCGHDCRPSRVHHDPPGKVERDPKSRGPLRSSPFLSFLLPRSPRSSSRFFFFRPGFALERAGSFTLPRQAS